MSLTRARLQNAAVDFYRRLDVPVCLHVGPFATEQLAKPWFQLRIFQKLDLVRIFSGRFL